MAYLFYGTLLYKMNKQYQFLSSTLVKELHPSRKLWILIKCISYPFIHCYNLWKTVYIHTVGKIGTLCSCTTPCLINNLTAISPSIVERFNSECTLERYMPFTLNVDFSLSEVKGLLLHTLIWYIVITIATSTSMSDWVENWTLHYKLLISPFTGPADSIDR